jgi:hypothetical protein
VPILAKVYARFDAWFMHLPKGVRNSVAFVMAVAVYILVGIFFVLLEKLDDLPPWVEWPIIAAMVLAFVIIFVRTTERNDKRKRGGAETTSTAVAVQSNAWAETLTVKKKCPKYYRTMHKRSSSPSD